MKKSLLEVGNLIIYRKEKSIRLYILFAILGVFMFLSNTSAQEESIQVGSTTRKMFVYAPPCIEKNMPLMISMHGMDGTMYNQKNETQFETIAKANNFVLVYPQGNNNAWQLSGTTDIDFISTIIDEMYKRYGIDRERVYLSGFSMGGMMSYYAVTKIADKIAAIAPVSGFLMGGPNTNSSRPVPIIHIHGSGDDFVPHSRVQECLDAWIDRNGCPVTPQVTKPYPVDKTTSNTKYYWGPGTDNVEIVFLSLIGIGHWYSIDTNGVNTSQEIWNFCKNHSLNYGVPKFIYASTTDNNPKQIEVTLSNPIIDSNYFKGFIVKINNQAVAIDSVVLADSNKLAINVSDSILNNSNITLSYLNGNVVSVYDKGLFNFNDTLVDNLLKGASPRLIEVTTNIGGDSLMAKFNKKMQIPSDISAITLNAEYNGQMNITVQQCSFLNNDSNLLVFPLDQKVYRDYKLLLTYSGNNIVSADSGLLKTVTDFQVTNNSDGLSAHIDSGEIETDGNTLLLKFSKAITMTKGQSEDFVLHVNGKRVMFANFSDLNNTLKFTLTNNVHHGDTVILSYTSGVVKAYDNGLLEEFSNFTIDNRVGAPDWIGIPGKIEAENYSSQWGTKTEQTGDTGGGLNVGHFEIGDWLDYAIENNTSETEYQVTFRVSAPGMPSEISFYIDGNIAGKITVPSTGNWQIYKSVDQNISIGQGKHYLKVVAETAGFNLNYMDIHEILTGIKNAKEANITIYPNPVSNEIIINTTDFRHNRIEIFDSMGKLLVNKATEGESVLHLPVQLTDGMYFVKINKGMQYQLKKIIVTNK
jgi:poly(3-hydroxybutyrate) depolymerase